MYRCGIYQITGGIFNSVQNTIHHNEILRKFETTEFHEDMRVITNERAKVIKCLKRGKAAGPDTQIIGCTILGVCFSAMLLHGYVPQGLMDTNSIPLVKKQMW